MASNVPRPQRRSGRWNRPPARIRRNWPRALRNGAVTVLVAAALFALVGFVLVPVVARGKIEAIGSRELGRPVTLGRVELNPFTLHARLLDFARGDRERQRFVARFDALDLDLSMVSLWQRAPVFDAVRLVHPQIKVTGNAESSRTLGSVCRSCRASRTRRHSGRLATG